MIKELVSIITPSYNSSKFIEETIASVQAQTYSYWEMLITDDGSTDNSFEIIKKICKKDSRIKLFSIKNAGPAVARNNSIKHAKGKYIAFIDSDDLWMSEFLSTSIKFITKSEGFVFSSYKRC
ncbi:glycosyltransferase, partial [Flavobacteriaceae bacterium]|nr:glycosyltransferase [Flavobacteriaceae bacterium]